LPGLRESMPHDNVGIIAPTAGQVVGSIEHALPSADLLAVLDLAVWSSYRLGAFANAAVEALPVENFSPSKDSISASRKILRV